MRYLCYFVHRHLDFRVPELEALYQCALLSLSQEGPQETGSLCEEEEGSPCSDVGPTVEGRGRPRPPGCGGPHGHGQALEGTISAGEGCRSGYVPAESSPLAQAQESTDLENLADGLGVADGAHLADVANTEAEVSSSQGQALESSSAASCLGADQISRAAAVDGSSAAVAGGAAAEVLQNSSSISSSVLETSAPVGMKSSSPRLRWWKPPGDPMDSPFFFADLPSDKVATFIAHKSMLLKGIFEVWGEGLSWDLMELSLRSFPISQMTPYLSPGTSFKIVVDGFGKLVPHAQQLQLMERLDFIPFQGRVDLKNPEHKFWIIMCNPPSNDPGNLTANGLPPDLPSRVFFARQVACSHRADIVTKYELKARGYLGPTAMDAELALIMANQAMARPGALVYDPFVGTGSILVAAAHFGAVTMGADIDIRTIRDGKGPNMNVWTNFKQYSLAPPAGLIRADNNCPPWRTGLTEIFDAIVCDPPYGVRAGGRKSGGRKLLKGELDPYTIPEPLRENHIPSTAPYTLAECLHDLLELAASMLTLGGRLVYFYPVLRERYTEGDIPRHPCLRIVANSEQILTRVWSRRLLTLEKVRPYTAEMHRRHAEAHERFRRNHKDIVEGAAERMVLMELRDTVFKHAPCEQPAAQHRMASVQGMSVDVHHEGERQIHSRPSYRAKCV